MDEGAQRQPRHDCVAAPLALGCWHETWAFMSTEPPLRAMRAVETRLLLRREGSPYPTGASAEALAIARRRAHQRVRLLGERGWALREGLERSARIGPR